jgi:hypothetical protein
MKDGGSAFPEVFTDDKRAYPEHRHYPDVHSAGGMSLRDYFAAHALAGLLPRRWEDDNGKVPANMHEIWAISAYKLADAMLKEREPQSGGS